MGESIKRTEPVNHSSIGLSIQCVVVSCLRAPWGAPHPAWRTAKGLLRPPYVFPRRSHRDGAAETAREGWVTTLSRWSFPEPLGEPQLKKLIRWLCFLAAAGGGGLRPYLRPLGLEGGAGPCATAWEESPDPARPQRCPARPPPFPPPGLHLRLHFRLHEVQSAEALYWIETTNRLAILQSNFNPKCSWPDWNWN